jgi:hypothetical protein
MSFFRHKRKPIVRVEQREKPIPPLVALIMMHRQVGMPIGMSTYDKAIAEHPEYFPEEVEHRKNWASIPQSVHDAYKAELDELYFKETGEKEIIPFGKGMAYWMEHLEEYEEFRKEQKILFEKRQQIERVLHEKYYSKYNIYNPYK